MTRKLPVKCWPPALGLALAVTALIIAWDASAGGLELTATSDKASYALGEVPQITLRLTNRRRQPTVVLPHSIALSQLRVRKQNEGDSKWRRITPLPFEGSMVPCISPGPEPQPYTLSPGASVSFPYRVSFDTGMLRALFHANPRWFDPNTANDLKLKLTEVGELGCATNYFILSGKGTFEVTLMYKLKSSGGLDNVVRQAKPAKLTFSIQ